MRICRGIPSFLHWGAQSVSFRCQQFTLLRHWQLVFLLLFVSQSVSREDHLSESQVLNIISFRMVLSMIYPFAYQLSKQQFPRIQFNKRSIAKSHSTELNRAASAEGQVDGRGETPDQFVPVASGTCADRIIVHAPIFHQFNFSDSLSHALHSSETNEWRFKCLRQTQHHKRTVSHQVRELGLEPVSQSIDSR